MNECMHCTVVIALHGGFAATPFIWGSKQLKLSFHYIFHYVDTPSTLLRKPHVTAAFVIKALFNLRHRCF